MLRIGCVVLLCVYVGVACASDLGKKTYQAACQNCHAPALSKAIRAPAAFDVNAWNARFDQAELEVKKHPSQFKTPMDYLVYHVTIGKGFMQHGGLCKESDIPTVDCSKKAYIQAIEYMRQSHP